MSLIDVYEGIRKYKNYEDKLLHNGRIRFRYAKEYPSDDRVDISEEDIKKLCEKLDDWSSKTGGDEPVFILREDYSIYGIIRKRDHFKGEYEFFITKSLSWEEAMKKRKEK